MGAGRSEPRGGALGALRLSGPPTPDWAYLGPRGALQWRQGAELEPAEWALRAGPEKRIGPGQASDGNPMPRRDTGNATYSIEVAILRAWINASRAESAIQRVAQFETAWLQLRHEIAHREQDLGTIADAYLPPDGVDPALRQLFALPSNQAQAQLLGERDDDSGAYRAGWADLSEPEFDATTLWLTLIEERDERGIIVTRLPMTWEIARAMTPKRARDRFGRRAWLKEETVERYLRGARHKLRALFGLTSPD